MKKTVIVITLLFFFWYVNTQVTGFGDQNSVPLRTTRTSKPTRITQNDLNESLKAKFEKMRIKKIDCGSTCLLLTDDGKLFSWGSDGNKKLGLLSDSNEEKEVYEVDSSLYTILTDKIIDVSSNDAMYLLTRDHKVYCYGANSNFNCAIGDSKSPIAINETQPMDLTILGAEKPYKIISGLWNSYYVIDTIGRLFAGGYNSNGKLGLGNTVTLITTPTQVTFESPEIPRIVHALGGYKHSIILSETGQVYSSGWNNYGQLGIGSSTSKTKFVLIDQSRFSNRRVIEIQIGRNSGYALDESGEVYSFGVDTNGQLGRGGTANIPVAITSNSWSPAKVRSLGSGGPVYHMNILATDNTVHGWGRNDNSHLGDGTTSQRNVPVQSTDSGLFDSFTIQHVVGTSQGAIAYSVCENGGYGFDCSFPNNESFTLEQKVNCKSINCAAKGSIFYDKLSSESELSIEVVPSDFDITSKSLSISTTAYNSNFAPSTPRNCDDYISVVENYKLSSGHTTGQFDYRFQPSSGITNPCLSTGYLLDSKIKLKLTPWYDVPAIWFTGEDFKELISGYFGFPNDVKIVPFQTNAFKFTSPFSAIEYNPKSSIPQNGGFSVSFYYTGTSGTVISYKNDTSTVFAISFEGSLICWINGVKYDSTIAPVSTLYLVVYKTNGEVIFYTDSMSTTVMTVPNFVLPVNGSLVLGQYYSEGELGSSYVPGKNLIGTLRQFKLHSKPLDNFIQTGEKAYKEMYSVFEFNNNLYDDQGLNHAIGFDYIQMTNQITLNPGGHIIINPVSPSMFPSTAFSFIWRYRTNSQNGTIFSYASEKGTEFELRTQNNNLFFIFGTEIIDLNFVTIDGTQRKLQINWDSTDGSFSFWYLHELKKTALVNKGYKIPKGGSFVWGKSQTISGEGLHNGISHMIMDYFYIYSNATYVGKCGGTYSSNPAGCNGRGYCRGETCSCDSGYQGSLCETEYQCFGISSSTPSVCMSHGSCSAPDYCSCAPGYVGQQCESRNLLWDDIIKPLILSGNSGKLDGETLKECVLLQGAPCFCNYTDNYVKFGCSSESVLESIEIKNAGLTGKFPDFRTINTLKKLDLSGNPLISFSTNFNNYLPNSIETLILNDSNQKIISTAFNISTLSNLKTVSFAGTSRICGSYLWNNLNTFIVFPTSRLFCEYSNSNCGLISADDHLILYGDESKYIFSFNEVDQICGFSKTTVYCKIEFENGTTTFETPLEVTNSNVTCDLSNNLNSLKTNISLVWGDSKIKISQTTNFHTVFSDYLERINKTVEYYADDSIVNFNFHTEIHQDLHQYLFCKISTSYFQANSLGGSKSKFYCTIPFSTQILDYNTYYAIDFYFNYESKNLKIGKSTMLMEKFKNYGVTSISKTIGETLVTHYIKLNSNLPIPRLLAQNIRLKTIDNSFISPNLPYFKSISDEILFEAENYAINTQRIEGFFNEYFPNGNSHLKSFVDYPPASFSQTGYSSISPSVKYVAEFGQIGIYYVWIRGTGNGTVFIGVDGNEASIEDYLPIIDTEINWKNDKSTGSRYNFSIDSIGSHTVEIFFRSGSVEMDKILLTKNSSFTPIDSGSDSSPFIGTQHPDMYTIVSQSTPGIFSYSMWYTSTIESYEITNTSNNFILMKKGNISGVHPHGGINRQQVNITLFTDIPYFNYGGNVSYHCKFGTKYFIANQNGSNFSCELYSSSFEFNIVSIQLIAKNVFTQEELLLSNTKPEFYFYGKLYSINLLFPEPLVYSKHYPYITKSTLKEFPITIDVTNYPKNDSRVYCRQIKENGDVQYHKSIELSENQIQCTLSITNVSLWNSDEIIVGIWANESTSFGESSFYISNNVSHLVFIDPFKTTIPSIISTGNFGKFFNINVSSLSISHLSTKFIVSPEYFGDTTEYIADCSGFTCIFPEVLIPYVPLNMNIKASFKWGTLPEINITGESFHYTEYLTILNENSFLVNLNSISTIYFNLSQNLNPLFDYYLIDENNVTQIPQIDSSTISGSFYSSTEKSSNVFLKVNTSVIGLVDIVPFASRIDFHDIMLSPLHFNIRNLISFNLYFGSNMNYTVPSKYSSSPSRFVLFITQNSVTKSALCSVDSVSTICGPYNFMDSSKSVIVGVSHLEFQNLTSENSFNLTFPKTNVLGYKTSNVEKFFPKISLSKNYTMTVDLQDEVMKFGDSYLLQNSQFYCKINGSSIEYPATLLSYKQFNCTIEYLGFNDIHLDLYLRSPQISNDSHLITTVSSTGYFTDQGYISFTEKNPERLFYTEQTSSVVQVKLNTSIPDSLLSKVRCSIKSDFSIFTTTIVHSNEDGNYFFNCTFFIETPKKYEMILVYYNSDYPSSMFTYSSNSLELAFVRKTSILSKNPAAGIFNRTVNLELKTQFVEVDYGNASYYCKYGLSNGDIYSNITTATLSNQQFTCDIYSEKILTYKVSIWMEVFDTMKQIVLVSEEFRFIDENFFTPSYGSTSGNEVVKIEEYKANLESDVVYKDYLTKKFPCNVTSGQLICISPNVENVISPFQSEELIFTNNSNPLGLEFILYKKLEIESIFPSVMPSKLGTTYPINITLNYNFTMLQGSVVVVVGVGNDAYISRYEQIPSVEQMVISENSIASLQPDSYSVGIFYKHPKSIEIQNQFLITGLYNVSFVNVKGTLSYTSSTSNIVYINETLILGVKYSNKLTSDEKEHIRCKLGNQIVSTTNNGSFFTCTVKGNSSSVQNLTLWYISDETINGEFQLSKTVLPVIFVDPISIKSIDPFASSSKMKLIPFISTNQKENYFTNFVEYQCRKENDSSIAQYSNSKFNCTMESISSFKSRNVSISLWIVSKMTHHSLRYSSNEIEYIFYEPYSMEYIYPFADSYSTGTKTLNISIPNGYHSDNSLYCQYNSTDGLKDTPAKSSGSHIYCTMTKTHFEKSTEEIEVTLIVKTSLETSVKHQLSLNSHTFVLFNQSIGFSFTDDYLDYTNANPSHPRITDYLVPKVSRLYSISYSALAPNSDSGIVPSCTAKSGNMLYCLLSTTQLSPVYQPAIYNFNLIIQFSTTVNLKHVLSLRPVTYFKNKKSISDISPRFASFRDSFKTKSNFYLNISHSFNTETFDFYCKGIYGTSNETQISPAVLISKDESSTLFKCSFNSRLKQETIYTQLFFDINNSKYYLSAVDTLKFYDNERLKKTHGFFQQKDISIDLPEIDSKSIYEIKFNYNSNLYSMENCTLSSTLSCNLPTFDLTFTSDSLELVLYVNGYESMKLYPYFQVYKIPKLISISPSKFFLTKKKQDLEFIGNNYDALPRGFSYYMKYIDSNRTWISDEICSYVSQTVITCSSPSIDTVDTIVAYISVNNVDFVNFTTITSYDQPTFSETTPVTTEIGKYETISCLANMNITSDTLKMKFTNAYVSEVVSATKNGNKISSTFPNLWSYQTLVYPIDLNVYASLDGINYYSCQKSIRVNGFNSFNMYPVDFPSYLEKLTFSISSFPTIQHEYGDIFSAKLVQNILTLENIEFNCTEQFKSCHSTNSISTSGNYSIEFYKNSVIIPVEFDTIINVFVMNSKVFIPNDLNVVKDTEIQYKFDQINETVNSKGFLWISFTEGVNYVQIPHELTLINVFSINLIENDQTPTSNVAYTFRSTNLTIHCSLLPSIEVPKIRFSNNFFNYDVPSTDILLLRNSIIQVKAPSFSEYKLQNNFSFPLSLKLGISYNDGVEYAESDFSYDKKILNVVFFSVTPNIIHREAKNLTTQGVGFEDVTKCQYRKLNDELIVETDPIFEGSTMICPIPKITDQSAITIDLLNKFEEITTGLPIIFYDRPIVNDISPKEGNPILHPTLTVSGIFPNATIYCKFGVTPCNDPCIWVSSNEIKCGLIPHSPGNTSFYISYNKLDWITGGENSLYYFDTCPVGYTAPNYTQTCTPCPLGTYKSTEGYYDCIKCDEGMFQNSTGQTSCFTCPGNKTSTVKGLKGENECVCKKNYFWNPDGSRTCLNCPIGASCPEYNMSIPNAKEGYWFSKDNIQVFYSCLPKASCPGYGASNCSAGYTGQRCGFCAERWYRSKTYCVQCDEILFSWGKLIVFAVAIGLIGIIFDFLAPACILPWIKYIHEYFFQISLPLVMLLGFICLYVAGICRAIFANHIGKKIAKALKIRYITPLKEKILDDYQKSKMTKIQLIKVQVGNIKILLFNEFIHGTKILEQTELPWDVEYEYKFEILSESDEDDPDDHIHGLNDIFDDLFSTRRFKKKVDIAKRKGAKFGVKIVSNTSKVRSRLSKRYSRESMFEESLKNIKDFDESQQKQKRSSMALNFDLALEKLQKASEKQTPKDEKVEIQKRIEEKRKERLNTIKKKAGSKVVEMRGRKKSLDGIDLIGTAHLSPDIQDNILFDSRRRSQDSDISFINKRSKESGSPGSPDSTLSTAKNFEEVKRIDR
eukprot:gene9960-2279_t